MEITENWNTLAIAAGAIALYASLVFLLYRRLFVLYSGGKGSVLRRRVITLSIAACAVALLVLTIALGYTLRGPALTIVAALTSIVMLLALVPLAANVLAGLVLRLTARLGEGDWVRVQGYSGRVARFGALTVALNSDAQEVILLPNLSLLMSPLSVQRSQSIRVSADISLSVSSDTRAVESILLHAASESGLSNPEISIVALEGRLVRYRVSGQLAGTRAPERAREDLLGAILVEIRIAGLLETQVSAAAAPAVAAMPQQTVAPATPERDAVVPTKPVADESKPAAATKQSGEVKELKREYTDTSQRLIEVEKALLAAGQGEERQPLSLEKKKLEAALTRIEKQIDKVQAGFSKAS